MVPDDMRALLDRKRILVCLGPGGVGKTTTAASLAIAGAMAGRKAMVLTIDPAKRLANALGLDELTHEQRRIPDDWWSAASLEPAGELHAMMLDTKRAADQLIEKHAPSPATRDRIMTNPLYEQVSTALSGSHDYLAMEKLYELRTEGDYDLLVLDTPPAAHALDFLEAPSRLLAGMDARAADGFIKPVAALGRSGVGFLNIAMRVVVAGLSRFTGGDLLADLARFLLAFSEMFGGFQARAQAVMDLLATDETAFLVITSPNRFAVEEAEFLRRALAERSLPFGGYIVNRYRPPFEGLPPQKEWPPADELADTLRRAHRALAIVEPTMLQRVVERLGTALREEDILAVAHADAIGRLLRGFDEDTLVVRVPDLGEDVHDLTSLLEVARAMGVAP